MRKGIVFDLDETLIDRKGSLDCYACRLWSSFQPRAVHSEEQFLAVFHQLDGNGRVPRPKFFEELSRVAFTNVDAAKIADHFDSVAWQKPMLFPRVLDVIRILKSRGYVIGVATNGGSVSQNAKIINSGLAPHLDAFVISEEFGATKPDPSIYEEITRRLHIDPTASWFVGDDPISDVIGPAEFGFATAWIERYLPWPAGLAVCYKRRITHISELSPELIGGAVE